MPDAHPGLVPHLIVDGANAAIKFYTEALGGTERFRAPAEDGKRLMHAEVAINGLLIYLCDDFPEFHDGKRSTPQALGGSPIVLHLNVDNADASIDRAVKAGGKCIMPAQDMFWGARYGQVLDPFGHLWSFSHQLPGKS